MFKIIKFALIWTFIFSLSSAQEKMLYYSTNPMYPPYYWSADGKIFRGASIELLEMAAPPGVLLKPLVFPWKRSLVMADEGSVNLLLSLRITPERLKFLNFTVHRAFPNPIVIFTRKDNPITFKTWDDLKKYRGGMSLGDTFGGGFDEYLKRELTIETAADMAVNFKKLELGRIDYFVSGYYLGIAYLKSNNMANIISLSPAISNQDIYFGFSKKYTAQYVIDYIDKKLEELDKKGVPEKLLKKYIDIYAEDPIELFK